MAFFLKSRHWTAHAHGHALLYGRAGRQKEAGTVHWTKCLIDLHDIKMAHLPGGIAILPCMPRFLALETSTDAALWLLLARHRAHAACVWMLLVVAHKCVYGFPIDKRKTVNVHSLCTQK